MLLVVDVLTIRQAACPISVHGQVADVKKDLAGQDAIAGSPLIS